MKIIFNRFNFIDKKCKLVDYKKNIYEKSIIVNLRKSNKTISVNKHEHQIREDSIS